MGIWWTIIYGGISGGSTMGKDWGYRIGDDDNISGNSGNGDDSAGSDYSGSNTSGSSIGSSLRSSSCQSKSIGVRLGS
jgi:hypothetical protein